MHARFATLGHQDAKPLGPPLPSVAHRAPHPLGLLRARRERPCRRPAEQRDERAAFQLIDLHSLPPARDGLQDIELTANSLRVSERPYNLFAVRRLRGAGKRQIDESRLFTDQDEGLFTNSAYTRRRLISDILRPLL